MSYNQRACWSFSFKSLDRLGCLVIHRSGNEGIMRSYLTLTADSHTLNFPMPNGCIIPIMLCVCTPVIHIMTILRTTLVGLVVEVPELGGVRLHPALSDFPLPAPLPGKPLPATATSTIHQQIPHDNPSARDIRCRRLSLNLRGTYYA